MHECVAVVWPPTSSEREHLLTTVPCMPLYVIGLNSHPCGSLVPLGEMMVVDAEECEFWLLSESLLL